MILKEVKNQDRHINIEGLINIEGSSIEGLVSISSISSKGEK